MAIATSTAIALSAGATAAGSIYSANQANKAASKGAQAVSDANDQSTAEMRRQFDQTRQDQMPFMESGYRQRAALDQALGLGPGSQFAQAGPLASGGYGQQSGPDWAGYVRANPDLMSSYDASGGQYGGIADFGQTHYQTHGQNEGRSLNLFGQPGGSYRPGSDMPTTLGAGAATPGINPAANDPMAGFKGSIFYQTPRDPRIMQGVNAMFSAKGMGLDGSAMKAAQDRIANDDYGRALDYTNMLAGGAATGLGAAQGIGSMGMNMASNNANLRANSANAMASSYQQRAQNNAGALGSVIGAGQWYGQNAGWFGGRK